MTDMGYLEYFEISFLVHIEQNQLIFSNKQHCDIWFFKNKSSKQKQNKKVIEI